jgi:hypothetical protein
LNSPLTLPYVGDHTTLEPTPKKQYAKQHGQVLVVFLFGLVLVFAGSMLSLLKYPSWATALVSVGCSLVAASVVTYLSPVSEDVYQKFLTLGVTDVYPSRREIANPQWVDWVRTARRNCTIVGIANNNWCRDPEFPKAVVDRLRSGVEIKIYFLDPTSSAAETRAQEDKVRDTLRTISESIQFVWKLRNDLDDTLKGRFKVYVYRATPSAGVLWIDNFMVVTHYLPGSANVTSPSLIVRPVSSASGKQDLYGVYADNVKIVEATYSTILSDDNVTNYIHSTHES